MSGETFEIENNDFGFTLVDSISEKAGREKRADQIRKLYQKKIDDLAKMIWPLLDNLSKDPEKDTILWPNRIDAIKKFRQKLEDFIAKEVE